MKLQKYAIVFALILLGLIALAAQTAAMAAEAPHRTMTLTGTGTVMTAPDKAVITVGVATNSRTAAAALKQNSASMTAVLDLLAAEGIAKKDIQTTNFSVSPRIVYDNKNRNKPPRVAGYTVTNQVRATVRDLAKIGPVLDKVVEAGSNRIDGIQFDISEPQPVHDEARRLAVRDAVRKAKLLAEEAGVKLGGIMSISDTTARPIQRPIAGFARASAEAAVPVAAGQQTVRQRVNITWEIVD